MAEVETEIKRITAKELAKLDFSKITILDLREPDEVLVKGLDGAVNIPFSRIGSGFDAVPKEKPVYVICRTGDFSEEVTEILTDRGYDAYNVEGGYNAFAEVIKNEKPLYIDAKGLKCPGPIVKVADAIKGLQNGQKVYVEATEDAFYSDIKVWCDRTGNKLLEISFDDGVIKAKIEKSAVADAKTAASHGNDKTFVVFSGDLDKTIAAFIMANGAAAMGRKVTMSLLFGGLISCESPKRFV